MTKDEASADGGSPNAGAQMLAELATLTPEDMATFQASYPAAMREWEAVQAQMAEPAALSADAPSSRHRERPGSGKAGAAARGRRAGSAREGRAT